MAELRTGLQTGLAVLRGDVRHMYAAIMGQFAPLLGLAYFFVNHVQR
jgi:hypothetical protein